MFHNPITRSAIFHINLESNNSNENSNIINIRDNNNIINTENPENKAEMEVINSLQLIMAQLLCGNQVIITIKSFVGKRNIISS